MSMTLRQLGVIADIGRKLGIVFYGSDSDSVSVADRFISKHISELRKYNKKHNLPKRPTGKQMKWILQIEKELDIVFDGMSYDDAWSFISEYRMEAVMHKDGIY